MAPEIQRTRASSLSRFRIHSDTPHSVGLFWTSERFMAETSTLLYNTLTRQTWKMHTHVLYYVATGIGKYASKKKQWTGP
jgi:hypothetical protein